MIEDRNAILAVSHDLKSATVKKKEKNQTAFAAERIK